MSDLINRQAAIDEVVAWLRDRMSDGKNGKPLTERLKALPSAQHEIVRCGNCKHGMYDMMCKFYWCHGVAHSANWYCADAERITNER